MIQGASIPRAHLVSLLALTQQGLVLCVQFLVAQRYGVQGVVDAWIAALALPAIANTVVSAMAGQLVMPALTAARQRGGTAAFQRTASELLGLFVMIGVVVGAPARVYESITSAGSPWRSRSSMTTSTAPEIGAPAMGDRIVHDGSVSGSRTNLASQTVLKPVMSVTSSRSRAALSNRMAKSMPMVENSME